MPQTEAKISKLRCEPYTADIPDCPDGYYGPHELILWRVFVDDVRVANEAMPFRVLDAVIELSANKCVPIFSDGDNYVSVRLLEDKIYWFGFHLSFLFTHMPSYDGSTLPTDFIYVFDAKQYQLAIDEAQLQQVQNTQHKEVESPPLRKIFNFLRGTPRENFKSIGINSEPKPLPVLTSTELSDVLRHLYPRDLDLPLYRMPELDSDRRGAELFRAVWNVINTQKARISEPPDSVIEIRIGLDMDVFVECLWQFGRVGNDIAILFVVEPNFPLWISGFQAINRFVDDAMKAID